MKVSEFNKHIQTGDLARNNLYSIEIFMPRGHEMGGVQTGVPGSPSKFGKFYTGADSEGASFLSYMAKTVTIPGKSIGTIEAKRFGPVYKVANDLIVDTVAMTFMCSSDYKEHKFFDGWISGIMGAVVPGTGKTVQHLDNRQIYTLSYYDSYISTVNIIPLDRQGGAAAQITLLEAYPTNVGPIEMAWGDAGEVANFTVTWSFRDWQHASVNGWGADPEETATGEEFYPDVWTKTAPGEDGSRDDAYPPNTLHLPTRESPGKDGSRAEAYNQITADGTRIGLVPHKTNRPPAHEGRGTESYPGGKPHHETRPAPGKEGSSQAPQE